MHATMSRSSPRNNFHIHDLPDVILSNIFKLVADTRTRNAMSLVCLKWVALERATRTSITLRGNIRHLFLLPTCFRAVTNLDLSFISPWGHPLLESSPNAVLLAQLFGRAFPSIVSLTIYVRTPTTLHLLAPQWPNLRHIKLVRWHQRSSSPLGSDFFPLLQHCSLLSSLDLSQFYCWTEDLPPALEAHPQVAASLCHLNILTHSSVEGFKSHELLAITAACPNLRRLLATCLFDHRFNGFVGHETLLALASNCPGLSLLHLADSASTYRDRTDSDDEGYTPEDARISHATLGALFAALPLLEELVLDVCHNVRSTGLSLELLASKCPRLKSLKLRHFHGIYNEINSQPGGIALCRGLESLSVYNSADLTDSGLIAISLGCPRLAKFEVYGCQEITEMGMRILASNLQKTLIDVRISSCKNFDALCSLKALQPIEDLIQRLHIDGAREGLQQSDEESGCSNQPVGFKKFRTEEQNFMGEESFLKKRLKCHSVGDSCYSQSSGGDGDPISSKAWGKLKYLSLRFAVGELMTPLALVGLEDCPVLEEIQIKIEGDCRNQPRPHMAAFGLSSLMCFPRLSKMQLDCGGATGYALTAPSGHADLSVWERFVLNGIGSLKLVELDYRPPQDTDVNHRSLSLPAAGLLAECKILRKLFIHGTANEHLMMFLLKILTLRDVQLREDYYPAPENDSSTDMRVDSCNRFEDALNSRWIPD
ncbi:hypothetical protein FEM48_Zijuj01G0043400 [Ziziphus jujuba var. spinosa]|nr:hypothetical protein FEM48_Zijuj01G0043400 [Ziziphus jujuba var. spinosa]